MRSARGRLGSWLSRVGIVVVLVASGLANAATPAIATGAVHGLALHSDGTVRAWGSDSAGELGVGRVLHSTGPSPASDTSGFTRVSAGLGFTLALKPDGTVWSWGDNSTGTLGDGTTQSRSTPRRIPGLGAVAAIAAGLNHAAVVKSDGTVWAWGYNASGAIGNGSGGIVTTPAQAGNLTGVIAVAVGSGHTLALKADGTVWAWGSNHDGALGDGTTTNRSMPVQVPGLSGIVAISATSHSLALKEDGTVWAWGPNHTGQLGDGGFSKRLSPFQLTSITGVSAISAGDRHTIALRAGEVWSWGEGVLNQLGDGSTGNRSVPGKVTGLSGVTAIWAGRGYHSFARLADGTMRGWGFNKYGQLGDGSTTDRALPTPVQNSGAFNDFAAGFYHTAKIADGVLVPVDWETVTIADGVVVGWGDNSAGQLGDGAPITRAAPVMVNGAADITAIAAGQAHSLGLRADGTVIGWGSNSDGVLGDGTTTSRSTPVAASGVTGANAIAAGIWHSLALRSGTVWGWGNGQEGQLGDGTFTVSRLNAVQAVGLTGVTAISAAFLHSVALRSGEVWTWGHNGAGQLGDGTLARRATPGRVNGLSGVTAISAGGDWYDNAHTLALRQGEVWAWGSNQRGQLGDGTITQRLTPVLVSGLSNIVAISAGGGHSVALRGDGTVWSWGYNGAGQLGDGTTIDRLAPVQVPGLGGIVAVSAGREFTLALKSDGTVLAWGWARYGSIGDGAYVTRLRPVVVVSEGGAGSLDANDWYLRLSASPTTVPAAFTPPMMAIAQQATDGSLDATVRYLQSELNRSVNHYVLALVPPEFFGMVGNAAANVPSMEALRAKSVDGLVLAQLTATGWNAVSGSLDPFSQGTSNAAAGSVRIAEGVPLGSLPNGTRFCIGYGENSQSMLSASALREVLRVGAPTSVESGVPCVLSGVYLDGPPQSLAGTPVTFNASVVGASPTGTLQFRDGSVNMLSPLALAAANPAVSRASITTSSLSVGQHSIIARYSGDANNTWGPTADVAPLVHTVASAQAGTSVSLAGPASSSVADEVAFVATITGNNPAGSVQFHDNGANLGAPVPVVGGQATLRTDTLAIGSHSFTAAYSGDSSNAASTSPPRSHTVYATVVTQVALSSSLNPATSGNTITFTATVTGNSPTGDVTFRAGGASLGAASMSGGVASLSTASLTAGTHYIVADYAGDANNQRVTSPTLAQVIRLPVTRSASGTTLSVSASPSTLAQSVTFTASVSGPTSPTGTVAFRAGATPIAGCGAVALAGGPALCRTNALPAGTHSITAEYSGNDNLMPSTSLALSHRVDAGATPLAASPASLEFGGQSMNTTSPVLTTRFTNAGPGAVTVTGVFAPAGFSVAAHDCGTLAAGAACDAQVRFTPDAEGAFDGLLALTHAGGGPAIARLAGAGERSLVTHYYRAILRRAADSGGAEYWAGEAARVAGLGANLNETWYAMALQFFNSAEYRGFDRDDTGFLTDLYGTFFNRAPDTSGLQYWLGLMAGGMPREVVLVSFLFSPEFTSFAQAIFGNTAARAEVDMVVDFYRGLLSRLPDSGGFQYWTGQFRTAQCQSPAAIYAQVEGISNAYVNSPEYAARNRTPAQFVGDMYNAFMRRGGDLDGVRFWVSQLQSGVRSREDVRRSFISTPEFAARVQAVVAQGCQR